MMFMPRQARPAQPALREGTNPLLHIFALFLALGAITSGCSSLSAGSLDAVGARSELPRRGHVYLVRGWNGLWSEGIDALAAELRSNGVEAHVYQQSQAAALGNALLEHEGGRDPAGREPLVLIGFSFGADETIRIAKTLASRGIPVDLLDTLDPVTPPTIPPNVRNCQNFYQSNGVWDVVPWLRGVPVRSAGDKGSVVTNTNLRDRADLLEPNTGHDTIAANPKLHRLIIEQVLRVCDERERNH
jgi:hypothetical protein